MRDFIKEFANITNHCPGHSPQLKCLAKGLVGVRFVSRQETNFGEHMQARLKQIRHRLCIISVIPLPCCILFKIYDNYDSILSWVSAADKLVHSG
jgi:hypothetical protein